MLLEKNLIINMLQYAILSTLNFIKILYHPLTIKIVPALTFFKSITIKTFTSQNLHFIIIYAFSELICSK